MRSQIREMFRMASVGPVCGTASGTGWRPRDSLTEWPPDATEAADVSSRPARLSAVEVCPTGTPGTSGVNVGWVDEAVDDREKTGHRLFVWCLNNHRISGCRLSV